jgi:hypothetical protein
MGDIIGLGLTHYPGLHMHEADMPVFLRRTLAGKCLPERLRDPHNWPKAMQAEWGDDEGVRAGREHRERCLTATREIRNRLDAFKPDLVVIFGDDQYENFVEDIVPPFCIYIVDEMRSRPFDVPPESGMPRRNIWNEPLDKTFIHHGHTEAARLITNRLSDEALPLPYAYRLRYERGLAHAFINTLLFLDVDRMGFPYPVVPIHVNCYGGALVRSHGGGIAPSEVLNEPDPPAPSASVCFDVGRAVGRALAASPWRVAILGSSSWSHAFLTPKNDFIYPDHASDRARLEELRAGNFARWRELDRIQLEDAGQHEFLNWVALAGAMSELGNKAEVIDYVESYVMNSNKCFAVFS